MTPVDDRLKKMYHDYLAEFGVRVFLSAANSARPHRRAKAYVERCRSHDRKALSDYPNVDAIYFQGALLDPIPIIDKLESAVKAPIVASNHGDALAGAFQAWTTLQHRRATASC
jgi:maleate cis-trans isomerase